MAKKSLPSSMGGITQYFENTGSKLTITPKQVIIATGVVVVLVMIFNIINPFNF